MRRLLIARRLLAARRLLIALLGTGAAFGAQAAGAAAKPLPPIHHVYIIVIENESVSKTFGPSSPAPYLSKTLRGRGAFLSNYYGIGHQSLDNYVAMVSGQAPNADTQADCQFYTDFPASTTGSYGQVAGEGCIYPQGVPTIASQLTSAHLTWRDYNDGMGANPARESSVCGHPTVNGMDNTQSATATDQYATRHNPFMYFHSIIDDTTLCDTHVVNLDALPQDLATSSAPSYSFITPNLCNDGHDAPCKNGGPGGLRQTDSFLRRVVPKITGSRTFRRDGGLLMILADESGTSDTKSCCGEIAGPASPRPGIGGPGGGDVGAVLLSPYIKSRTVSNVPYNHYTMLRSVEDLFGLPHIGFAQLPGERSFGSDIFACAPAAAGHQVERVRIARRHATRRLKLYSVGAAALRVVVRGHGRRLVIRRTLVPCRSLSLKLPRGSGYRVSLSAGTQTITRRY